MKTTNIAGIKPRTPKQIARAGATLAMGMVFLPFVPFTKKGISKTYSPNPGLHDTLKTKRRFK